MLLPKCFYFILVQCIVWSFFCAPGNDKTKLWLVLIRFLSMAWYLLLKSGTRGSSHEVPVSCSLILISHDSQFQFPLTWSSQSCEALLHITSLGFSVLLYGAILNVSPMRQLFWETYYLPKDMSKNLKPTWTFYVLCLWVLAKWSEKENNVLLLTLSSSHSHLFIYLLLESESLSSSSSK